MELLMAGIAVVGLLQAWQIMALNDIKKWVHDVQDRVDRLENNLVFQLKGANHV